jgi:hypothetical protein
LRRFGDLDVLALQGFVQCEIVQPMIIDGPAQVENFEGLTVNFHGLQDVEQIEGCRRTSRGVVAGWTQA